MRVCVCLQCDDAAGGEHTSEPDTATVLQSQQTSPPAPSAPEPATLPPLSPTDPDNVLSNTPPPVNRAPTERRLVPLDLQPFVRSAAVLVCS